MRNSRSKGSGAHPVRQALPESIRKFGILLKENGDEFLQERGVTLQAMQCGGVIPVGGHGELVCLRRPIDQERERKISCAPPYSSANDGTPLSR